MPADLGQRQGRHDRQVVRRHARQRDRSHGVDGLTTIVPISAISSWYDYTRYQWVRTRTNYPAILSNTVTDPDRRAHCAPLRGC